MRGIWGLGVVVAAFAAGAGLGLFLGDDDSGSGTRASRIVVEGAAREAPGPSRPIDREHEDSLRELLERIPHEEPPRGTGRVTGVVRTEDGEPLEGVEIVAQPHRNRSGRKRSMAGARPDDDDIVEYVRDRVASRLWYTSGTVSARSGSDGSFVIEGLGDSQYQMRGYKEGYSVSAVGNWLVAPGAQLDFTASVVVRIPVEVVMRGAGPPERAQVAVTTRSGGGTSTRYESWSPQERWIELKPGTYELTAQLDAEIGGKSDPQSVTIAAGEAATPLQFEIVMRPAIRLTVRKPEDIRGANAYGWLLLAPTEGSMSAETLTANGQMQFGGGPSGDLIWKDLEPGKYVVGAAFGHEYPVTMQTVEVVTGVVPVAIDLPVPSGPGVLLVRPHGPEGEPITNIQWMVRHQRENGSSSSSRSSLVRNDGVHILASREEGDYEGGTHTVEASTPTWGTVSRTYDPKSKEVVDLPFAKPANVTCTIAGYSGSGYEGRVQYKWQSAGAGRQHVWFHDPKPIPSDGTIEMPPQQPGEQLLCLYVSTSRHNWSEIAAQPCHLRPGKQSVTIAMPALHKLRVVWTGEGKPQIGLSRERTAKDPPYVFGHVQTRVGEDGAAEFDALTPGRYAVSVSGRRTSEMPMVEIPAQTEVRLP